MSKSIVSTDAAPAAVGPYSQAVASGGSIFCSGQVGLDPASGSLVDGSIQDETRRALTNLGAVLAAAGASFEDVVKVTAYLVDMGDFASFNDAYAESFSDAKPARATVGVAALPLGARVEVECIAHV
jgi:2-iminobutanoate/2-iminopropanoate deaminase